MPVPPLPPGIREPRPRVPPAAEPATEPVGRATTPLAGRPRVPEGGPRWRPPAVLDHRHERGNHPAGTPGAGRLPVRLPPGTHPPTGGGTARGEKKDPGLVRALRQL